MRSSLCTRRALPACELLGRKLGGRRRRANPAFHEQPHLPRAAAGCAFFFGGLKYKEQRFSKTANKVSSSLLFLACIGILIPSAGRIVYGRHVITRHVLLNLSHVIALTLLLIYVGYLLFQLKTHADCFEDGGGGGEDEEGEGGEDAATLSLVGAFSMLAIITAVVGACSELLTGAIEEVADTLNVNEAFLGLIVLPIAGNVTEHLTASRRRCAAGGSAHRQRPRDCPAVHATHAALRLPRLARAPWCLDGSIGPPCVLPRRPCLWLSRTRWIWPSA